MAESRRDVVARSGRSARDVTIEALAAGQLTTEDIMISAEALLAQAAQAREHGYEPMARNFERAAEMTALPDDEILTMYEALRPFRSSAAELESIAARLDAASARHCAALVREAAEAYADRGCLRAESSTAGSGKAPRLGNANAARGVAADR